LKPTFGLGLLLTLVSLSLAALLQEGVPSRPDTGGRLPSQLSRRSPALPFLLLLSQLSRSGLEDSTAFPLKKLIEKLFHVTHFMSGYFFQNYKIWKSEIFFLLMGSLDERKVSSLLEKGELLVSALPPPRLLWLLLSQATLELRDKGVCVPASSTGLLSPKIVFWTLRRNESTSFGS